MQPEKIMLIRGSTFVLTIKINPSHSPLKNFDDVLKELEELYVVESENKNLQQFKEKSPIVGDFIEKLSD